MVDQVGRDVSKVTDTVMTSLHLELQRCAPALDSFFPGAFRSLDLKSLFQHLLLDFSLH